MATEAPEVEAEEAGAEQEPAAKKDNFMFKVIVVSVILMVLMALQFMMLYMFLGGSAEPAENGDIANVPAIGDEESEGGGDFVEAEIDTFNCTNHLAAQGSTIHVTFRLNVTVASKNFEPFKQSANRDNKHRVRQAINKIIRSASLEDLKDPELDRIKMKIREDVNKILSKSYINDVIITDFKPMEQ